MKEKAKAMIDRELTRDRGRVARLCRRRIAGRPHAGGDRLAGRAIPSKPRWSPHWRAQADAIRARYGAVANEPVPERLQLDRIEREQRRTRAGARVRWRRSRRPRSVRLRCRRRRRLVRAWRDRQHVERRRQDHRRRGRSLSALCRRGASPGRSARLRTRAYEEWLSKRVGYPLNIPDLQSIGLKLVGGTAVAGTDRRRRVLYV